VSALEQHERAGAAFPPGRAGFPADDLGQGFWPERRLDAGAHGVQIDPDSGQRVPVQAAEQDRSRSGTTGDLRRDIFDRGTVLVQDGARRPRVVSRVNSGDQDGQEMLAADVATGDPARVPQGAGDRGAGVPGQVLGITGSRSACRACGARSAW
jgi:hypothetical protein